MRKSPLVMTLLLGLLPVNAAFAQEPPHYDPAPTEMSHSDRYPALGQGDTTPGSPALPQDLELTVAAGIGYAPEYMGADDYEAIFVPAIDFEYKDRAFLVVNRDAMMVPYEGLGVKLLANQDVSFGMNVTYDAGRDDDSSFIRGIGEQDWTALGGVFAAYHPGPFFVRGNVGYDLLGEYNSYKGEIGLGVTGVLTPPWRGKIELSTAFAGEDYTDSYWGITSGQSAATGGRLAAYSPDGGSFYRTSLDGVLQYQFTQGAFVQGLARVDVLTGEASDSPIVEDKTQFLFAATAGYKF